MYVWSLSDDEGGITCMFGFSLMMREVSHVWSLPDDEGGITCMFGVSLMMREVSHVCLDSP